MEDDSGVDPATGAGAAPPPGVDEEQELRPAADEEDVDDDEDYEEEGPPPELVAQAASQVVAEGQKADPAAEAAAAWEWLQALKHTAAHGPEAAAAAASSAAAAAATAPSVAGGAASAAHGPRDRRIARWLYNYERRDPPTSSAAAAPAAGLPTRPVSAPLLNRGREINLAFPYSGADNDFVPPDQPGGFSLVDAGETLAFLFTQFPIMSPVGAKPHRLGMGLAKFVRVHGERASTGSYYNWGAKLTMVPGHKFVAGWDTELVEPRFDALVAQQGWESLRREVSVFNAVAGAMGAAFLEGMHCCPTWLTYGATKRLNVDDAGLRGCRKIKLVIGFCQCQARTIGQRDSPRDDTTTYECRLFERAAGHEQSGTLTITVDGELFCQQYETKRRVHCLRTTNEAAVRAWIRLAVVVIATTLRLLDIPLSKIDTTALCFTHKTKQVVAPGGTLVVERRSVPGLPAVSGFRLHLSTVDTVHPSILVIPFNKRLPPATRLYKMARLLILYGLDGQQRELGEALLFLLEEWMHRAPYPSAVAKISPVTRLPALRVVLRGADGCLLAHDCLTNDRIRMLEAGGHAGAAAPGAAALLEEGPGALGRWVHYLLCALTGGDSEESVHRTVRSLYLAARATGGNTFAASARGRVAGAGPGRIDWRAVEDWAAVALYLATDKTINAYAQAWPVGTEPFSPLSQLLAHGDGGYFSFQVYLFTMLALGPAFGLVNYYRQGRFGVLKAEEGLPFKKLLQRWPAGLQLATDGFAPLFPPPTRDGLSAALEQELQRRAMPFQDMLSVITVIGEMRGMAPGTPAKRAYEEILLPRANRWVAQLPPAAAGPAAAGSNFHLSASILAVPIAAGLLQVQFENGRLLLEGSPPDSLDKQQEWVQILGRALADLGPYLDSTTVVGLQELCLSGNFWTRGWSKPVRMADNLGAALALCRKLERSMHGFQTPPSLAARTAFLAPASAAQGQAKAARKSKA